MDDYQTDAGGINSLSGFAYQIRVFVLYMLTMEKDMQTEFETLEDVVLNNLSPNTIDSNEDQFKSCIGSFAGIKAIQVKRRNIDRSIARQVLLNWILLESSGKNVMEYVLYTSGEYGNSNILFDISAENLYSEVLSTTKEKATISKVKNKYINDADGFVKIYNSIQRKYSFIAENDVDKRIEEKCEVLFKKAGVNPVTYYNRIKELLTYITVEVINHINEKETYQICYNKMMAKAEEICNRITDQIFLPAYSDFKKVNNIDLDDLQVAKSREYKQLSACGISGNLIVTQLLHRSYYQYISYCYKELNKLTKISDIEETTYENYERVKCKLQYEGKDTPFNRFFGTQEQSNSYADCEQIKNGSSIYLTREGELERQISWEDKDNAKD